LKNSNRRNSNSNSNKDERARASWAERCAASYDNSMKKINRQIFLPHAWIPFILGGIVRGSRKDLPCLIATEDEVKDKPSFNQEFNLELKEPFQHK